MINNHTSFIPAWQANLQKKLTACSSFCKDLGSAPDTIAFVQEPKCYGRRMGFVPSTHRALVGTTKAPCRAALLVPKSLAPSCFILSEWSNKDLVVVRCSIFLAISLLS